MANMGRDSNGCQFFVTLQPAPQLDGKHVVFGRLVAGMALLRQLEEMPTDATERPATPIVITRCGALSRAEALAATAAEGGASASVEYGGGLARPGERARGAEAGRERAERAAALDLGGEALVLAAAKGDVHMLRSLVASGVPIDAYGTVQGEGGGGAVECCALHVAARAGDAATLSALLAGGADAGLRDSRGSGALHLAVLAGSAPCARLLLGVGCPQHELDGDGRAPVHAAVAAGVLQVLQVLLDADASVASLPCASLLPVHVAAAADQGSAVRLLASARAAARLGGAAGRGASHALPPRCRRAPTSTCSPPRSMRRCTSLRRPADGAPSPPWSSAGRASPSGASGRARRRCTARASAAGWPSLGRCWGRARRWARRTRAAPPLFIGRAVRARATSLLRCSRRAPPSTL